MRQHQGKKTAWGGQESRAGGNKGGGNRGRPPRPPATNVMCAPSTAVVPGPPARVGCDDRHCGGKKQVSRAPPPPASPTAWLAAQVCPLGGGPMREPRARPHPKLQRRTGRALHRGVACVRNAMPRGATGPLLYAPAGRGGGVGVLKVKGSCTQTNWPRSARRTPRICRNLNHGRGAARQLLRCTRCPWAPPCIGWWRRGAVQNIWGCRLCGATSVRTWSATGAREHGPRGFLETPPPPTPRNRRSAQVVHAARGRQAP